MNNIVTYQFITDYTTPRGDFHQCFEVSREPYGNESPEKSKAACIEHIKRVIRSRGYLLTHLWIAHSELTVDELQELSDGKTPANARGKVTFLEEVEI